MSRTRFEAAREVPLTDTELKYLEKLVERDLHALRGGKSYGEAPAAQLFLERLSCKLSRVLRRAL